MIGFIVNSAGTIAGTERGIAKDAQLVAVKVTTNGEGKGSDLLAGIQYIQGQKELNRSTPMVANLSVGLGQDGFSETINDAVNELVAQGVVVVVASGNYKSNACNSSPASASSAITVAASDRHDNFYSDSSYGTCVDLIAPGQLIFSNWIFSSTSTNTISGTSSAAAHGTGVVALLLEQDPGRSPDDVRSTLLANTLSDRVQGSLQGSPNRLLNTLALVGGPIEQEALKCAPFLGFLGCQCCRQCIFFFICLAI